ncbi:MAG TPA: MBL fold metallo-hydrolase, partial [Candidatus Limnocylindrales bacterium]|nr:MBL fold metallo-hydrolase [Candidatus Limnocylindrales bacterium]
HYHGDHAGGVPYLILDGQFSKRERPLVIAGPRSVRERIATLFEAALPTSSTTRQRFGPTYVDLSDAASVIGPMSVTVVPVAHLAATVPHGIRITLGGKTIGYTGDSAWCDAIPVLARDADLFIAECYTFTKSVPLHLSHADLVRHRDQLRASRVILTHPGPETIAHRDELAWPLAEDGLSVAL